VKYRRVWHTSFDRLEERLANEKGPKNG